MNKTPCPCALQAAFASFYFTCKYSLYTKQIVISQAQSLYMGTRAAIFA